MLESSSSFIRSWGEYNQLLVASHYSSLTLVKVEEMVVEEHCRVSGEAGAVREETNLELSSDISPLLSSCQKHIISSEVFQLSHVSHINKYLQIYFFFCSITMQ